MKIYLAAAALLLAQAPQPRPAFEVASIKRNLSGSTNSSTRGQPGGRITITNRSLRNIVQEINRLQGYQIDGGPDWIDKDRWDIVAKGEGDPSFERMAEMMKTLLADRFKLRTHRETREMPIYALVLARPDGQLGPQMKASTFDCAALVAATRAQGGPPPPPPGSGPRCGTNMNYGRMRTSATSLADIVRNLSIVTGRGVVDRTGLKGIFDLDLTFRPEVVDGPPGATPPAAADDAPSLFTAVQEQLGLKLEPQRGPVEVLVIDSADRPLDD
jgi:uncharacterized protein (TIGR03435 family)